MKQTLLGLSFGLLLAGPSFAAEADWPGFRGPKRDGASPDKGLLRKWPAAGPKLLWKSGGLGVGFSSVSMVGDQIFTMGDVDGGCFLFALGREDGKQLWKTRVGDAGGNYAGPRCTPTIADG
ncbi:MAG: PQQ-binding-like beta-propeller repeat protein, partial [Planctomycetia bacterium]